MMDRGACGAARRAITGMFALGAGLAAVQYAGQGGLVAAAWGAPKADLPPAKECFAEPQIVAAAKVPGRFFPVQRTQVPVWLDALAATAELELPDGDDLLVFITAAPHGTAEEIWPAGSGNLFVMREGCLIWHGKLQPQRVLDLVDRVDVLRGGGEDVVTPVSGEAEPAG